MGLNTLVFDFIHGFVLDIKQVPCKLVGMGACFLRIFSEDING
jgi:hypothetical protein